MLLEVRRKGSLGFTTRFISRNGELFPSTVLLVLGGDIGRDEVGAIGLKKTFLSGPLAPSRP